MNKQKISYKDVLAYQISMLGSDKKIPKKEFISDDKIIIVGIFQYTPENPDAVGKFKKIICKCN